MSALSDRIAAEHWFTGNNGWHCVGCGYSDIGRGEDYGAASRRHLADVAERAVRDAIVAELMVQADRWSDNAARHRADSIAAVTERGTRTHMQTAHAFRNKASAMFDAIRTARGESAP